VSAVCSVLLVVVCGEVIPKVLAVKFADRLAPFSAAVVRGAGTVAEPIGRLIDAVLARPVERMMLGPQPRPASKQDVTIDELKALLHLSRQRGDIDRVENEFLREVIDLRSVRVREVMVPRVDVVAYDVNQPAEGLRDLMRSTRLKKVPVYEGSVDNLIGVVYAKVLFLNRVGLACVLIVRCGSCPRWPRAKNAPALRERYPTSDCVEVWRHGRGSNAGGRA
jgi:CBS domain containing-hemolysin-like protein